MNALIEQARAAFARLNPRERRLVGVFGVLLCCAAVFVMVIEPVLGGRTRLEADVRKHRAEVIELRRLAADLRVAGASLSGEEESDREVPAGFSLLAFLERTAAASLQPENVTAMSPSKRNVEGGGEESNVELKLTKVSLEQLVALLRDIEDADVPVTVKRLSMKKRYDSKSEFDASVSASVLKAG